MISKQLIEQANADLVGVIERYGVKLQKKGSEYLGLCPFHGEKSPSFTVKPNDGFYHCFGCGASGDAIGFVREFEGLDFTDAVSKISGNLPVDFDAKKSRESNKISQDGEWVPVDVVPDNAPQPPSNKWIVAPSGVAIPSKFKSFTGSGGDTLVLHDVANRYAYYNADGLLAGYTVRFDCAWGGKEVIPQTWCVNTQTGVSQWKWLSFKKPRPLYGLEKLLKHPKAQVILVEGEKATDKAQSLYEEAGVTRDRLIILSWAGGGKAVKHTDWSPLSGRTVGFWPDADKQNYPTNHVKAGQLVPYLEQPGVACMLDVAARIKNPAKLQIFTPPEDVPNGWDLADEFPAGFNLMAHTKSASSSIPDFIKKHTVVVIEPPPPPPPVVVASEDDIDGDDAHSDDLVANTHFTVLGYDGDHYFFFHHGKKQILRRTKGDFTEVGLIELAPINWWEENFPAKEKFNKTAAINWLFWLANSRGIYDSTRVRGRGAWVDKGRIVYHHGKQLSVDGVPCEITKIKSAYVYTLGHNLPKPRTPMTNEEGRHLIKVASLARWSMPGSAALLAGWVMLSPICGALTWRPHIWLTGGAGSGKTTLQIKYCGGITKGISIRANGNSTEAGIRQELRCDARPVLVDEFESNNEREKQRVENVISLIRQTSTETQAQTFKGTVSGTGMNFDVRSMFCLASINTNLPTKADVDRLSILTLRPALVGEEDNWFQLEAELNKIDEDAELPGRLLARCLTLMPVILGSIKVFRRVAASKFKRQRDGDQYGTLLAGCWCLTKDKIPTDAEAMALIDFYNWSEHREESGNDEAMRALEAILSAKLRVAAGSVHGEWSVYELIRELSPMHRRDLVSPEIADATLKRHGIRVERDVGQVWFGTTVTPLLTLVQKMPFVTDLRGQLLRVEGAIRLEKSKKFNGSDSRVVAIPLSPILAAEKTGDPDEDIPF